MLDDAIGDASRLMTSPGNALADCRELLSLYQVEGITDARVTQVCYDAFQICITHGDEARASSFARMAYEKRLYLERIALERATMKGPNGELCAGGSWPVTFVAVNVNMRHHFKFIAVLGLLIEAVLHGIQGSLLLQPFPSKIWQSWKDDSEPERTTGFPHQWRIINPGWRYERITDTNNDAYVQSYFARIAEVFTKLNDPVMKADYLRYLILLREGGVWA
ncbi:hypothetical protein V493_00719, partial [Pseudogymnoascus sp. VKM F-4281 (FW-2241)]